MTSFNDFYGPNAGYVVELYDRYRQNPASVNEDIRTFFEHWTPPTETAPTLPVDLEKIVEAVNLAQIIRDNGHLEAQVDPLGRKPPGDPDLSLEAHGISEADLVRLPASLIGGSLVQTGNAAEALQELRNIYSSTIGYDYSHIQSLEERRWLQEAAESRRYQLASDPSNFKMLLKRLTQIEAFEQFLHRLFPGKFRFSIEGLDMLVPILDEIINHALEAGNRTILIGMPHRGRLNILAHVLNKPYAQIFAEFKDPIQSVPYRNDLGWTGDVKYHLGARKSADNNRTDRLMISMAPNPSHLEAVNPVVEGMARATGTRVDRPGAAQFDFNATLPILIHGDAAFPGQGIVAETLNLSRLSGYWVGGTIHIIGNNQLGFTALPEENRSTLYASDLAKGFEIPIVHVNADDPEACLEVARLALAYRTKFQKDFLIDLIGYRRYGHNESDEPSFTQPVMYSLIQKHPTVREQWANTLRQRNIIAIGEAEDILQQDTEELQKVLASLDAEKDLDSGKPVPPPPGMARRTKTTVPIQNLQGFIPALLQVPETFKLHPKLQRVLQRRREMVKNPDETMIDWAMAEELAFATILADGIPIRLTGQDVERGTFSQRHAVFHDVETGAVFIPLQQLPNARAAFEIHNSPLSENAALGFEYGYNIQEPSRLVLWEAQYGDFDNNAQVIIDEFIASARAKWGQTPSLVLLLPHGMEGSGPDHANARLERFLQLAAGTNLRIANCTTAAQYFHLLRRQAALLRTDPLPLVIMTPKSLLRHPRVASSLQALAEGQWQSVIDNSDVQQPDAIRRLLLCSGKIYLDLSGEKREQNRTVAIARIEQLYPFPTEDLKPILNRYSALEEVVWIQEEPENMGAWTFVQPRLNELLNGRYPLRYIGRPASSSPAEGSSAWYALNQQSIINQGLEWTPDNTARREK